MPEFYLIFARKKINFPDFLGEGGTVPISYPYANRAECACIVKEDPATRAFSAGVELHVFDRYTP